MAAPYTEVLPRSISKHFGALCLFYCYGKSEFIFVGDAALGVPRNLLHAQRDAEGGVPYIS